MEGGGGDERKRTTRREVDAANVRPRAGPWPPLPPAPSTRENPPVAPVNQRAGVEQSWPLTHRPVVQTHISEASRGRASRMQVSPASPVACSALLTAVLPRLRKPTWWFGRTRKFEVAPMLPDALRGSQLSPCSPRRHSLLLHLAQVEPAPTGTTTPMKHCVHASATTRASMLDSIG